MSNTLTTADLRYQIRYLDGRSTTVALVVADRVAADAVARRYGYESNEIKLYAAAHAAARRAGTNETWEEFAESVLAVELVDVQGRPVQAVNGVFTVDEEEVEEDPTQPAT